MNYKMALSAAFVAAVGLTGCDSRDTARDSGSTNVDQTAGSVQSGTTSPGTGNTATTGAANVGQNSVGTSANAPTNVNNTKGTGTQEGDYANVNANREEEMKNRKVNPDHARGAKAKAKAPVAKPAQPTSGATSDDIGASDENLNENDASLESPNPGIADNDVYHSNDDLDADDSVASGSTTSPTEPRSSYSQTDFPGGISPEDRNLRYGLVGNGTGMGLEDTTSKFMTDNHTVSDPKLLNDLNVVSSGALSAPTDDQDALKDIKSGTSFDADHYEIED